MRYDRCESCPRGKHGVVKKAKTIQEGCNSCISGTYSEVEAVKRADNCKGCPKGKWSSAVSVTKESACINCGTGKYGRDQVGANAETMCTMCGKGRYLGKVGTFGSSSCLVCPLGFVQNIAGQAFCLPCTP